MTFVIKDDFKSNMRSYRLDQILDGDDTVMETAITEAESVVINHLFQAYDTTSIFSQSGSSRNQTVVLWVKYIALYLVYERVPDEKVPERVVKNYDDTMALLGKVAEGKVSLNLPSKLIPGTGEKKTKFRGVGECTRNNKL